MKLGMDTDAQLIQYFGSLWSHLDEHARRLVAASKAVELGYGGISRVSRFCGLSRVTITKGVEELQTVPLAPGRIRQEGGGRHALTANDPGLAPALDRMVEPTARRSAVASALDLQERSRAGGRTDGSPSPGQSHEGHPTSQGERLQPPRQPQKRGRRRSSRSGCAVQAYQPRRQKRLARR